MSFVMHKEIIISLVMHDVIIGSNISITTATVIFVTNFILFHLYVFYMSREIACYAVGTQSGTL